MESSLQCCHSKGGIVGVAAWENQQCCQGSGGTKMMGQHHEDSNVRTVVSGW